MSMIDQIANEIIITSGLLHTNNVSRIAEQLGYRPMLIITALHKAGDDGKFSYHQKSDTIKISEDVEADKLQCTEATTELSELIEVFMGYLNRDEKDMSVEELQMMLGGVPDFHIRLAVHISDKLDTYEFADPKDKKSVYTFITLKENLDKKFGTKQFDEKQSKARKFADRVVKEAKKAK